MPRKNLALEIALVVCALLGAFIVQAVISQTKPPQMPEFEDTAQNSDAAARSKIELIENNSESSSTDAIPEAFDPDLSSLGRAPDWNLLDRYQYSVSRAEFVRLISEVYSVGDYWKDWFILEDDHVEIRMRASDPEQLYKLSFKNEVVSATNSRYWRSKSELLDRAEGKPLLGLRIAIDPGHIGGEFAQMEERRMVLSEDSPPIQEGNMTLIVAEMLVEQLEVLGATVTLVRDENAPVNKYRESDYYAYAKSKLLAKKLPVTEATVKREAQRLFYRNGEIRARAQIVNEEVKPDLVLCIHFNAGSEPDPENPKLLEKEHFHMILNGAYTQSEMAHDDERFQCVLKIVQGSHAEEAKLAAAAARSFVKLTGLPAYQYAANSSRAVKVDDNAYLWGRNLIANRLYDCPVLYFEPYLMNGADSYVRMQVGDYPALRFVNHKLRPSIYREYVQAVTRGLVDYYTSEEKSDEEEASEEEADGADEPQQDPIIGVPLHEQMEVE